MKPTKEQERELWEACRVIFLSEAGYHGSYHLFGLDGREWISDKPPLIDLNNLFKYAVPLVIPRLESRFDEDTNKVRALEILFDKWIDKIMEGYSFEDALFWAIYPIIVGKGTT